jgi:hypothetical protein
MRLMSAKKTCNYYNLSLLVDEVATQRDENFSRLSTISRKNMSRIKIINLQPENQVEQWELSEADITAVMGGIEVKLLGNNIVDATFGGFRLTW